MSIADIVLEKEVHASESTSEKVILEIPDIYESNYMIQAFSQSQGGLSQSSNRINVNLSDPKSPDMNATIVASALIAVLVILLLPLAIFMWVNQVFLNCNSWNKCPSGGSRVRAHRGLAVATQVGVHLLAPLAQEHFFEMHQCHFAVHWYSKFCIQQPIFATTLLRHRSWEQVALALIINLR